MIQLVIIFIAFMAVYQTVIKEMAYTWNVNDNFSYGYLIPFIAGYMIYITLKQDGIPPIRPANSGIIVIVSGMLILLVGKIGNEYFLQRFSIIVVLFGVSIFLYGVKFAKTIRIPLFYLLLMIPIPAIIWNHLSFPLQLFSATITANIVELLGIPLFQEGNILHLPSTTLEVVDACSGLRSLTSLIALNGAMAYLANLSKVNKILMFIASIPIAVFGNIVRLTVTVLLATYYNPAAADGFLHDVSGIVVFIIALILICLLYRLLRFIEFRSNAYR